MCYRFLTIGCYMRLGIFNNTLYINNASEIFNFPNQFEKLRKVFCRSMFSFNSYIGRPVYRFSNHFSLTFVDLFRQTGQ